MVLDGGVVGEGENSEKENSLEKVKELEKVK